MTLGGSEKLRPSANRDLYCGRSEISALLSTLTRDSTDMKNSSKKRPLDSVRAGSRVIILVNARLGSFFAPFISESGELTVSVCDGKAMLFLNIRSSLSARVLVFSESVAPKNALRSNALSSSLFSSSEKKGIALMLAGNEPSQTPSTMACFIPEARSESASPIITLSSPVGSAPISTPSRE